MPKTIQIRLKDDEEWMKDAVQKLKESNDPTYRGRSESDIVKMLLYEVLKKHEIDSKQK